MLFYYFFQENITGQKSKWKGIKETKSLNNTIHTINAAITGNNATISNLSKIANTLNSLVKLL